MIRSLAAVLMLGLAAGPAHGQQSTSSAQRTSEAVPRSKVEFPARPELLRQIALYEAAAQRADTEHWTDESLVKIYSHLGGLYEDAAMYLKSEAAMRRAIALLRTGQQNELAAEIGHLAVLHIAIGELREAENEQLEALRVRESVREPLGIAQTWNDLADVYIKQRHYKKAMDYARRAMEVLGDDPKVDVAERILVRQTLAYALCGERHCAPAVPLLKDAIELAKSSFGADSLEVGVGDYLLGYACWQSGDLVDAAEWMERGTARMRVDMGWGHPVYVNAMSQYARFLRERGQVEAAVTAEREVRQAEAVVDVRSFTGRTGELGAAAPR